MQNVSSPAPASKSSDTIPDAGPELSADDRIPNSYWDVYNEVTLFTNRATDGPLAAHAATIDTYTSRDTYPPLDYLQKVRDEIWLMHRSARAKLLNGWTFPPIGTADREGRDFLTKTEFNAPVRWGLQMRAGADRISACHGEWFEDSSPPVQLNIIVGADRDEVIGSLLKIVAIVKTGWPKLVAPNLGLAEWPERNAAATPKPRCADRINVENVHSRDPVKNPLEDVDPPKPKAAPVSPFDDFFEKTADLLDRLKVSYDNVEGCVLMPDGTKRELYQVSEQVGVGSKMTDAEWFLGPIAEEEPEAEAGSAE